MADADIDKIQRTHFRVDVSNQDLSLRYLLLLNDQPIVPESLVGKILNISNGGLLVRGPLPDAKLVADLGAGLVIHDCRAVLDDIGAFHALAQIRWIKSDKANNYLMGLQFIELLDNSKAKLEKFLIRNQLKSRSSRYHRDLLLNPEILRGVNVQPEYRSTSAEGTREGQKNR